MENLNGKIFNVCISIWFTLVLIIIRLHKMHWMRMGLGVRAGHQKWLNHFESAILFVHNYCVRMCEWVVGGCVCVWVCVWV